MDHPAKQIHVVIRQLTEGTPNEQKNALETYFLPDATFKHPLCTVPPFTPFRIPILNIEITSRLIILMIYRWYKIISPTIQLTVKSRDYNQGAQVLFVEMTQIFRLFFLPWKAPLNLTTKLHLEQSKETGKYFISHQEDLYQSNELVKIFIPHQISDFLILCAQLCATGLCIFGAVALSPVTWLAQSRANSHRTT